MGGGACEGEKRVKCRGSALVQGGGQHDAASRSSAAAATASQPALLVLVRRPVSGAPWHHHPRTHPPIHQLGESQGALIVSAYPEGIVPYDRTLLSKELLDFEAAALRSSDGFPVLKTEAGDVMDAAWYAANGITILFGHTCEAVTLESSELVLRSAAAPDKTTTVGFEQLVIATGSRPRTLGVGEAPPFDAPGLWHDDLKSQALSTEEEKGLEVGEA